MIQDIHLNIFRTAPSLLRLLLASEEQRSEPTKAKPNEQWEAEHRDGEGIEGPKPSDAIPRDIKEKDGVDQAGDIDHGVHGVDWSHPDTNTGALHS